MLDKSQLAEVRRAVVSLPDKEGRGVLTHGSLVITAAHCLEFDTDGSMVLDDYHLANVQTETGERFRLKIIAVEPVSDLAVLGEPDTQEQGFAHDVEAFERFCAQTSPVPICHEESVKEGEFPVQVLNRSGEWVKAMAELFAPEAHQLWIEPEEPIEAGASGGPILTDNGKLIGVVSNMSEESMLIGNCPCLPRALPVWIVHRITAM